MNILLTGAAGFIGSHLAEKLLEHGHYVIGIDNFDSFYSRNIKEHNISIATTYSNYNFIEADICDENLWNNLIGHQIDIIIHLAAKAGVRPSMSHPLDYNRTNITGTNMVLEFARNKGIKRVIFASSSSVYGINKNLPWHVEEKDLLPISIYAYSKQSAEKLCELYQMNFGLKITALRFFTVFGPRQRPDLAIHKFVKAIDKGELVTLFGNGQTFRDYTYIDDIVNGIIGAIAYESDNFEIFNLGNTHTVSLIDLIQTIESIMGKKANIHFGPEQAGDVPYTWSNIEKSQQLLGYNPQTSINEGITHFVNWYKNK
jgi:UDP-glucuronate 4-epimerase